MARVPGSVPEFTRALGEVIDELVKRGILAWAPDHPHVTPDEAWCFDLTGSGFSGGTGDLAARLTIRLLQYLHLPLVQVTVSKGRIGSGDLAALLYNFCNPGAATEFHFQADLESTLARLQAPGALAPHLPVQSTRRQRSVETGTTSRGSHRRPLRSCPCGLTPRARGVVRFCFSSDNLDTVTIYQQNDLVNRPTTRCEDTLTQQPTWQMAIFMPLGWRFVSIQAAIKRLDLPPGVCTLDESLRSSSRRCIRWTLLDATEYPQIVVMSTSIGHRRTETPTVRPALEALQALVARADLPFRGQLIVVGQERQAFAELAFASITRMTLGQFTAQLPDLLGCRVSA
jgi:hypothetical protein